MIHNTIISIEIHEKKPLVSFVRFNAFKSLYLDVWYATLATLMAIFLLPL